jgi:hypothetical protein
MSSRRIAAIAALIAFPVFGQAAPRSRTADTSVTGIMARSSTHPNAASLQSVLRQTDATYSRAKLDQIADSLVSKAIDRRTSVAVSDQYRIALEAVGALSRAGSRTTLEGQPYEGALDRLITIHQRGEADRVRARALAGMLGLAGSRTRSLDYLRSVAESTDPSAYDAVECLITDANGGSWVGIEPTTAQRQESISALNQLAASKRVTNLHAATLLDGWSQNHATRAP